MSNVIGLVLLLSEDLQMLSYAFEPDLRFSHMPQWMRK